MFLRKTTQSRVFIKAIMAFVLCLISLSPICSAEKVAVVATGEYIMGDGETKTVAKERADLEAMRSATEKAGVYVESYTKTINSVVDEDIIKTISSNILMVQKKEYSLEILGDSIKVISKITAMIDTSSIEANTNLVVKNRQLIEQNKALNQQYDDCLAELKDLKTQLNTVKTQEDKTKVETAIKDNEKKFKAIVSLNEGISLYNKHDYNNAILKYSEAVEFDADLAPAYANRGNAYGVLGKYDIALADLNKAIQLKDNVFWFYSDRGNIHVMMQNRDLALDDFNKAIALYPYSAKIYGDRSNVYYGKKEYLNAMNDAIKSVELDPYNASGYISKAMIFEKLDKPDKALENYNKALELQEEATIYILRGMFFENRKDYEYAMADYDHAIKLDRNNYRTLEAKGVLLLKLHKYQDALKCADLGMKLDSSIAVFYAIKAASYYHLNNLPLAKNNLLQALNLRPQDKDYYAMIIEY